MAGSKQVTEEVQQQGSAPRLPASPTAARRPRRTAAKRAM